MDLLAERHRHDPKLLSLSAPSRRVVGEIWKERAASELGAGSGFSQAIVGLYAIGAAPEVLELATRAAHEEVEHARACHTLAELYLDEKLVMPRATKVEVPRHRGATDTLRATLHVVGLSCINETIAAEFVAACLDASEASAVREANQKHLRDEIGHARVGWAHLASGVLDRADRASVGAWMPRLLEANGTYWLSRVRAMPEDGAPGHGYPSAAELVAAVKRAIETIVVPGLDHVGIDAAAARKTARALV